MIGKSTIKRIKSLAIKKYRQKEKLFLVEGDKNVLEVLHSTYEVHQLFATETFLSENRASTKHAGHIIPATEEEIKKLSLQKNPQRSLAVCYIPSNNRLPEELINLSVYLDGIQDPGNLGTIIRICDWFGIDQIFCSPDTADIYNPKVIQASMGSFCRINVNYMSFEIALDVARNSNVPVYGTFLNGENIYTKKLPTSALLVIGNEGNGIRETVKKEIDNKITIPRLDQQNSGAESLNVAVATGIICAEFKRQQIF